MTDTPDARSAEQQTPTSKELKERRVCVRFYTGVLPLTPPTHSPTSVCSLRRLLEFARGPVAVYALAKYTTATKALAQVATQLQSLIYEPIEHLPLHFLHHLCIIFTHPIRIHLFL